MQLAELAKDKIWMYDKGAEIVKVPYMDLERGRKRFVKFIKIVGQWVYVDLVD